MSKLFKQLKEAARLRDSAAPAADKTSLLQQAMERASENESRRAAAPPATADLFDQGAPSGEAAVPAPPGEDAHAAQAATVRARQEAEGARAARERERAAIQAHEAARERLAAEEALRAAAEDRAGAEAAAAHAERERAEAERLALAAERAKAQAQAQAAQHARQRAAAEAAALAHATERLEASQQALRAAEERAQAQADAHARQAATAEARESHSRAQARLATLQQRSPADEARVLRWGGMAAGAAAIALFIAWQLGAFHPGVPVIEAASGKAAREWPGMRLETTLDLRRTDAAPRSSPPGPAPSR